MFTVYSQTGCPRTRRVKAWFKENEIPYENAVLLNTLLETDQMNDLLCRIQDYCEIADLCDLSKEDRADQKQVLSYLQNNPTALYRPVILFEGNEDRTSIQQLQDYLALEMSHHCPDSCPYVSFCHKARNNDRTALIQIQEN